MNKRAPTTRELLTIVLFALSCFGLILYLWIAFGGPSPLQPVGYRFTVDFPQSSQLAQQADTRISGVSVGKVVKVGLGPNNSTRATIQLDARYAPARIDMKAILRTKTLLGETYVELTPGSPNAPAIHEDGHLAQSQVAGAVALDEIFRAFNKPTREAWQTWMQAMAAGFRGRGKDISNAFGNLVPFADNADDLSTILDAQSRDVQQVVKSTGTVFSALSHRQGQLQQLVRSADATFAATGAADQAIADTFRILPGFERQSRKTLLQLDTLADEASPLLDALQPAVAQMTPTFTSLATVAPSLLGTLNGLSALTKASKEGFPALVDITGDLEQIFSDLRAPLSNLNPLLTWLGQYTPEISSFVANTTAASQAHVVVGREGYPGVLRHALRATVAVNPLSLATFSQRPGSDKANGYPLPGTLGDPGNLNVFSTANCANGNPPVTGEPSAEDSAEIVELLAVLGVTRQGTPGESVDVPSPGCTAQGPFTVDGASSMYPHLTQAPVTR